MTEPTSAARRILAGAELENVMVAISKSAELAGHLHNPEAVDRARRILVGEKTLDEALTEIDAKYRQPDEE